MAVAAVDVYYPKNFARSACVVFDSWSCDSIAQTHVTEVSSTAPYEPGAFYKRELPCILKVLEQVDLSRLETIVVDGYVYLDDQGKPGLGAHLFHQLNKVVPVVGVAKTFFFDSSSLVRKVIRGESKRPLFVSSIGMDLELAVSKIKDMSGPNRIPTILKRLDQMTKQASTAGY